MERYTPEIWMAFFTLIRNIVLILTCGATVCWLYYWSRSWHSLWPLLMLLALGSTHFIRD